MITSVQYSGVKLLCSSKWFNPCFHLYGEP